MTKKEIKKEIKTLKKLQKINIKYPEIFKEHNGIRNFRRDVIDNCDDRIKVLENMLITEVCPKCNGKKGAVESFNDGMGQRDSDWYDCNHCNGKGRI